MRIPRPDDPRDPNQAMAVEDAQQRAAEARRLLEEAVDVQWYDLPGSDVDRAALALCRLRRSAAGGRGAIRQGDDAVRRVLAEASPEALVWIASRAISYLDETGFPDAVAPWFPEEGQADYS